jgi:hypothetical protein
VTAYISEYSRSVGGRYRQPTTGQGPSRTYALQGSTGAYSTTPQPGTQYLRVSCDVPMLLALNLTSTVALTSTNAVRVPANAAPEVFAVSTANLIQAAVSPT